MRKTLFLLFACVSTFASAQLNIQQLKACAKEGDKDCQLALGISYYTGQGINKDLTQAAVWLEKAAAQGSADAQTMIGECYLHGNGVKQDLRKAYEWLLKAAKQNDAIAQYLVGEFHYNGWICAGLSSQVKATFNDYEVDTRQPKMKVENALLYYPDYFGQPLLGVLEDKAGLESEEDKVSYPRFRSYDEEVLVHDIYKNIDYIGGLEFDAVVIVGVDKGRVPQVTSTESGRQTERD